MSSEGKPGQLQDSLMISAPDTKEIAETVHEIFFAAEPGTELGIVEAGLAKLDEQGIPESAPLRHALQSAWHFFQACSVLASGQFLPARDLFESAATGFSELGQALARDLAVGMGVYCEAVIQVQQKNIGQAQTLLQQVKQYLQEAGKYTNRYEFLVEMYEPEAYFIAGVNAAMEMDSAQATVLITKASQAIDHFAEKHFEQDDPSSKYFKGLGRFYQAYNVLLETFNSYNQFQFARIAARGDLTTDARQAKELLTESKIDNAIAKNLIGSAEMILATLEVMKDLSSTMLKVFDSTFKPNLRNQHSLREKVQSAVDAASKAGPQAQILVRFCEMLRNQIENLETLAKPRKKDFGIFGGLVSCALFLPIFLLISWSSSRFELQLSGTTILQYSLFPALIGGFGFGAIKFWRAFFPRGKATEND